MTLDKGRSPYVYWRDYSQQLSMIHFFNILPEPQWQEDRENL